MKRLLFTIAGMLIFVACTAQFRMPQGFIPGNYTTAQMLALNSAKNGQCLYNTETNTLHCYDADVGVWVDQGAGGGGGSVTVDNAITDGSPNPVQNNAIYDRFVLTVDEASNSPDQIQFWKGNKAQFYAEYGNPPTGVPANVLHIVTDSIPAASGADMMKSVYDINDDGVVDNSEQLNGQNPSFYLDNATHTGEVVGSTTLTIAPGAVALENMANNSVDGSKTVDGSLNGADVQNESLTSEDLAPNSVGTSELQDDSVTIDKVANNSINGDKIVDQTINGFADIQDESVTQSELAPNSVGTSELQDNAVGVDELDDSATGPPTDGQILSTNGTNLDWIDFESNDVFTCTFIDDGGGATYSGITNANYYYKVGKQVNFTINLSNINTTGTPSGNLKIGPLPFTSNLPGFNVSFGKILLQGTNFASLYGEIINDEIIISYTTGSGSSTSLLPASSLALAEITVSGTFYTTD